jgi:transcriptional regulator with XRE-family HTH domain
MYDGMGYKSREVNPVMGNPPQNVLRYDVDVVNGLKAARLKAGLTQERAAQALGLSKSGYIKKEHSERALKDDFIRRACEVFGVPPEQILGVPGGISFSQDVDPSRLASLILLARERLGVLPEPEARNLILALISASRRPLGPPDGG